jgi:hypothetical protein
MWLSLAAGGALLLAASTASADPILLTDPVGDTFGKGPIQHDITTYGTITDLTSRTVTFIVNFAGPIAAPSANAPNSVVGFIDIDADRNPATGNTSPFVNSFAGPPPFSLGSEFSLSLFSEVFHPGSVDFTTGTGTLIGQAPITFNPTGFTIVAPLSFFAPFTSGDFNFAVVVGTLLESTDRAPNGATPAESFIIPEPATLALFAAGLIGLCGCRWRRKHTGA